MGALVAFLVSEIPQAISLIKKISATAPAAIDTVKELSRFVERTVEELKKPNVLRTPEQDADLDRAIEELETLPWWQPSQKKTDH